MQAPSIQSGKSSDLTNLDEECDTEQEAEFLFANTSKATQKQTETISKKMEVLEQR